MKGRGLAIAAALALLAADLLGEPHGAGWHAWPGFDLLYGLGGCAAIVWLSKALGRAGVQQPEGFYDEERP